MHPGELGDSQRRPRHLISGDMSFLLFPAADLVAGLPKLGFAKGANMTGKIMVDFVRGLADFGLTKEALATVKAAGVRVWKTQLAPGETLWVPPGFLVSCAVLKDQPAYGFRKAFLPAENRALNNLNALAHAFVDNVAATKFLTPTIDSLKLAMAPKGVT